MRFRRRRQNAQLPVHFLPRLAVAVFAIYEQSKTSPWLCYLIILDDRDRRPIAWAGRNHHATEACDSGLVSQRTTVTVGISKIQIGRVQKSSHFLSSLAPIRGILVVGSLLCCARMIYLVLC